MITLNVLVVATCEIATWKFFQGYRIPRHIYIFTLPGRSTASIALYTYDGATRLLISSPATRTARYSYKTNPTSYTRRRFLHSGKTKKTKKKRFPGLTINFVKRHQIASFVQTIGRTNTTRYITDTMKSELFL